MCSERARGASRGSPHRFSSQATCARDGATCPKSRMADDVLPIIVNGAAGTVERGDLREALEAAFAKHGVRVEVYPAASGAEITELAQRAARARPRAVVAAGGDGTLNAVA